jgi:Skp family chaperone for outer membrane proteins
MKITLADKLVAWLALISGLSISAVAVYYSVAGLVSIFAAAAVPIMVMGVVLELSKLVATVWLKLNWSIAPRLIRLYLFVAVIILMMITSMGIFGYLSKAHLDQAVPTGDVVAKVAIIDEKIKTQRDNIEASRRALTQMDAAVDQTMSRSSDEKGADKAANLRRSQAKERGNLQNDIARAQKEIAVLNEQRAPVAAELRKVEAEVGPIKYIAALLYGDNPDSNLLEKAVRFVIILIVVIFDPLAVVLLLASQYSFQWFRKQGEAVIDDAPATPTEKIEPIIVPVVVPEDVSEVHSESVPDPDSLHPVYPKTEDEIEEYRNALADAKEQVWDLPMEEQSTADKILQAGVVNSSPADNVPLTEKLDDSPPFEGIKDPADGEWVQTGPSFEKPPVVEVKAPVMEALKVELDPSLEEALLKIIKEGEKKGHWDAKDLEPAIKVVEAPPGTPGEAWDLAPSTKSEQRVEDNLDKIYKASSEKLAKENRSRTWFQANFPKRDDN